MFERFKSIEKLEAQLRDWWYENVRLKFGEKFAFERKEYIYGRPLKDALIEILGSTRREIQYAKAMMKLNGTKPSFSEHMHNVKGHDLAVKICKRKNWRAFYNGSPMTGYEVSIVEMTHS